MDKKVKELRPYLQEIFFQDDFPVVGVKFKSSWKINIENEEVDYKVKDKGQGGVYLIFTSKNGDIDTVFNEVEHIIEYNKELEEKKKLLKAKMKELERIFEDHSLKELEGLSFELSDNEDESVESGDVNNSSNEEVDIPKKFDPTTTT